MPEEVINKSSQPSINVKKVLTLVLGAMDKLYWYGGYKNPPLAVTDFSSGGVRKFLIEKQVSIKGLYVFIKPSAQFRYQNMVHILDEMVIAGITRYSMVEATKEDAKLIKDLNVISEVILP